MVRGEMPKLQVAGARLRPDQADAHLPALHLAEDRHAVADVDPQPDVRVAVVELGKDGREQVLAGDGARAELEFATNRNDLSRHLLPRLVVKREDALCVRVESPPGVSEDDTAAAAVKQGLPDALFEDLNTLANG